MAFIEKKTDFTQATATFSAVNPTMASFQESLCGCINDIFSCYIAACCPGGVCFLSARAATEAKKGGFCLYCLGATCFCCLGTALNRGVVRRRYKFVGSFYEDLSLHCLCPICAVTQEYREVMKKEYIELKQTREDA